MTQLALRNRTRTSESIPARLWRDGKPQLIPLYLLLRLAFLGREGIENNGSFRFADHVYAGRPRGSWPFGWLLDALLLRLPAARSLRNRYLHARDEIVRELRARGTGPLSVLSLPAGIPREMCEAGLALQHGPSPVAVQFCAMDLDPEPLQLGEQYVAEAAPSLLSSFSFERGDALAAIEARERFDIVTSSGLADFLDDEAIAKLYRNLYARLKPGGMLITSASVRHPLSDWMMRTFCEMHAHYRRADELRTILQAAQFEHVETTRDPVGFQVLVRARKPRHLGGA